MSPRRPRAFCVSPLLAAALHLALAALTLAGVPGRAAAQEPGDWNAPRALELVAGARDVRQATAVDSTFRDYRSRAQGFVYFFLDRPDEEEHTLIKTDQIMVEVHWKAPDQARQRIIGLRDEKSLPTNINYHLDHLTVVQDDFQDRIRIGDGDEVESVIHPAAPGAEVLYDYRLTDSLSLSYAGLPEPIRVYQLQVRPRNLDAPGFVGTLYLDRGTSAIVRMAFTFTAASYVDPYLDYIRISLDNALWLGRYWLPHRQEVELRRELPQLDFMAGSIIRGRWEVGEYEFNRDPPPFFFRAPPVTAVPRSIREQYPFEDDLYSDLDASGLAPSPSLEEIQDEVREMAVGSALEGLGPARLHLNSVSDALRRNRVEDWAFGLGTTLRPMNTPVRLQGGYAFGAERGWAAAQIALDELLPGLELEGSWNRLTDIGPHPGSSRLVNTLATLGGQDYLDPYWVSGGAVTWSRGSRATSRFSLRARVEEHRSGRLYDDDGDTSFRPVRPVAEGTDAGLEVEFSRGIPGRGSTASLTLGGGYLDDAYASVEGHLGWSRYSPSSAVGGEITLDGGWVSVDAPPQALFLLGGRGTLPGFRYRDAAGDAYLLARGWIRRQTLAPWISLRLTAAAGWSGLVNRSLPPGWTGEADPGVRTSLGLGIDLLWDILQVDVARGLPDGDWSLFFSVSPRFTPWL